MSTLMFTTDADVARVCAIDPGPSESAFVLFEVGSEIIIERGKWPNRQVIDYLATYRDYGPSTTLVIEQVAAMGMAVGAEVFETVFWSGRFAERWQGRWDRIKRHEVKTHLCGNQRAKDANIRQALLDRFGGKEKAIGKKKTPGPLYGLAGDEWSALAIAIVWSDTRNITHHE